MRSVGCNRNARVRNGSRSISSKPDQTGGAVMAQDMPTNAKENA
jgi:hypothetical protein